MNDFNTLLNWLTRYYAQMGAGGTNPYGQPQAMMPGFPGGGQSRPDPWAGTGGPHPIETDEHGRRLPEPRHPSWPQPSSLDDPYVHFRDLQRDPNSPWYGHDFDRKGLGGWSGEPRPMTATGPWRPIPAPAPQPQPGTATSPWRPIPAPAPGSDGVPWWDRPGGNGGTDLVPVGPGVQNNPYIGTAIEFDLGPAGPGIQSIDPLQNYDWREWNLSDPRYR